MRLVISDLSKSRHGTSLLNGVNLELRSGAIHGLFGRNGAGKSTLLNIIANRLVADAGSVSFDGNRMTDGGGMWERLMLMDETWPYPVEWRLRSVFRLISRRYGGFDDVLAGRMMQAFGLRPDARFMRLSTGQRGAAKLVAALCAPTDIVLLDEATDGLDAAARDLCYRFVIESYGDRPRPWAGAGILRHERVVTTWADAVGAGRIGAAVLGRQWFAYAVGNHSRWSADCRRAWRAICTDAGGRCHEVFRSQ